MAINFPSGVANGTVSGNYTYDSSIPGWRKTPENSASLPAGTIVQWPGATAPANWLICDGSAVSRTAYASLFSAIGVQYGSGDGTTTFNLPNLKGRVAVGLDSSQGEFNTLGETGGAKTHTLTSAEMPSHTHTFSGTTSTDGAHTHTSSSGYPFVTDLGAGNALPTASGNNYGFRNNGANTASAGAHTHTYSGTTSSVGSDSAHNNLQPYIVLNYIIKTSAGITSSDSELATRVGAVESANNSTPLSANYVINGALDYWQRSTSATQGGNSSGLPSADRMRIISSGASSPAITLARSTDVPPGIGVQYSAAMSWSSNISGGDIILHHGIENGKYLLAGKTVTVSFYAKAATAISTGFNFDQDYGNTSFSLTTSWTRYTYTITLPSTYATSRPSGTAANDNVELRFLRFTNVSSASNTVYFTGVQVEEGAYATPFRRSTSNLQAEFAACQRYYQKYSYANGMAVVMSHAVGTGSCLAVKDLPVAMRAAPTMTVSSAAHFNYHVPGVIQQATTTFTQNQNTVSSVMFTLSGAAGTFTYGHSGRIESNNNSAAFMFESEI